MYKPILHSNYPRKVGNPEDTLGLLDSVPDGIFDRPRKNFNLFWSTYFWILTTPVNISHF